jgi:transmembrane sensor
VQHSLNHIDELIGKYLAREANAEESARLETWVAQSEENRNYFQQFKLIFDKSARVKERPDFNTDEAWNKVRAKLHHKTGGKTINVGSSFGAMQLLRIAASIVLISAIGFFTYRAIQSSRPVTLEVATEKESEADTLPDGSGVYLNKETKLAYAYDKKKKTHRVKLQGEAYFNIQHEDDKVFLVEAGDVFIKDIGTSFNVKAYPDGKTIEVVVEDGEVMFYSEKDTGVYLKRGGKGIYHKDTKTFTVSEAEANVTAYKTRFFIFSDTDLATVVQNLNQVYDKRIVIGKNLMSCRLTVSFNNEDIDEIASVLAETLDLTVKTSDLQIVLEGKGCED